MNTRVVFVLKERPTKDGPRTFWTKVGIAFENRDGSTTVRLDALPLDGVLQVRDEDHVVNRSGAPASRPQVDRDAFLATLETYRHAIVGEQQCETSEELTRAELTTNRAQDALLAVAGVLP